MSPLKVGHTIEMEWPADHLCHGDKECTGCLQSQGICGPPPSPTYVCTSKAKPSEELKVDTSTGKSWLYSDAKEALQPSRVPLENPFTGSSPGPQLLPNTFGRRIQESMGMGFICEYLQ